MPVRFSNKTTRLLTGLLAMDFAPLDNAIWGALTTAQRALARGSGLARRFPSEVSPLAALQQPTPAAFADLAQLVGSQESVGLVTCEPLQVPSEWEVVRSRWIDRMVLSEAAPRADLSRETVPPLLLDQTDVPEMLALTAATEPGPFVEGTIRMGRYFGVRSRGGDLIAMAGERLRLDGFTEISAVCTDPRFQGRGHAGALVTYLVALIVSEGRIPFLHVKSENGAKSLYEKLGFRVRHAMQLTVLTRR
jgi:predicted GNAT family acetyltransferase